MEITVLSQNTVDKGSRDVILSSSVENIYFTSHLFDNSIYLLRIISPQKNDFSITKEMTFLSEEMIFYPKKRFFITKNE